MSGTEGRGQRHINLVVVRQAEDDLRRSIGSTLDIGSEVIRDIAGAAKVYNLDFATAIGANKDVFGLEIAVDKSQCVHELKAH